MMDLSKAPDHPAVILNDYSGGLTRSVSAMRERTVIDKAVSLLRSHESMKDVTFAALDNETLVRLQEAWDDLYPQNDPDAHVAACDRLIEAVRDLLGMDD